jgi:hypothetical protein
LIQKIKNKIKHDSLKINGKIIIDFKNKNQLIFDSTKSQIQYYYVFLKYKKKVFVLDDQLNPYLFLIR